MARGPITKRDHMLSKLLMVYGQEYAAASLDLLVMIENSRSLEVDLLDSEGNKIELYDDQDS